MPSLKKCSEQIKTQKKLKVLLNKSTFCWLCCRKELSELWNSHNQLTDHSSQQADLIRQLQSLQHDTQKSKCVQRCQNKQNKNKVKTESRSEQNEQKVCESWLNTKVGKFELVKTRISMKKNICNHQNELNTKVDKKK